MVTFRISCISSGNRKKEKIIATAAAGVAEDAPGRRPGRQRSGAQEVWNSTAILPSARGCRVKTTSQNFSTFSSFRNSNFYLFITIFGFTMKKCIKMSTNKPNWCTASWDSPWNCEKIVSHWAANGIQIRDP